MKPIRNWLAVCVCVAFAMATWHAYAQTDLFALETAYIFNFTQFTRWPADATRSELTVCASAHSPLRNGLAALNGRAIGSLAWRFQPLSDKGQQGDCNVLVLSGPDDVTSGVREMFASDRPVLIVSEDATMMPGPVVIRLIEQDDHLRFDIDNTEASRRHLSLSSKLLSLARRVM